MAGSLASSFLDFERFAVYLFAAQEHMLDVTAVGNVLGRIALNDQNVSRKTLLQ